MRRSRQHPNLGMERLLQELEAEGVDPCLIDNFVARSLDRSRRKQDSVVVAAVQHENA